LQQKNKKMENQNQTTDRPLVTGMFSDRDSAERAYQSLHSRGYTKDDINLIMSDEARKRHFGNEVVQTDLGSKAVEGLGTGSAIGGSLGAIAGAVAAIGTSLLIPGLGVVVAGPLAAAIAGAGAGGVTGGIIGALVGSGIPKERAVVYEKGVKDGHIVMGVRARNDDDATYFENDWHKNNAVEIHR
jgi:hypothetical protein